MALFAISDLHLSLGTDKPMDVFGETWHNYEQRMMENWNTVVTPEDTVIIAGDISWATYLENTDKDFLYIDRLNGSKIILKGNHDYWWTTMAKMNNYRDEKAFNTLNFLQNNSYDINGVSICGTRGWLPWQSCSSDEDKKIYNREIERLQLSIKSAKNNTKIVALHYPPDEGFINIMTENDIRACVFGHLHAKAQKNAQQGNFFGIDFMLVSCDYLNFVPKSVQI